MKIVFFILATLNSGSFASSSVKMQCSSDIQSRQNVIEVCVEHRDDGAFLEVYRYLSSGELQREEFPFSALRFEKSESDQAGTLIAKSLGDEEIVRAKNFGSAPLSPSK